MTKFEQLMLRAQHAELRMLREVAIALAAVTYSETIDVMHDIEHELTAGAIDERDETHG